MYILSSLAALGLVYSVSNLPGAAATYSFKLEDSSGSAVPFETFAVPGTSRHDATSSTNAKRQSIEYVPNWCGAILTEPPSGETFTSVTGTWTIPTVTPPADGTSTDATYYLYQWVGIDGYYWTDSCDALIQSGTGFILANGAVESLFVWTEYYPSGVVGVNMAASEGDVFTVTVTTTSTTTGVITIENVTTGQTLTSDIDGTGIGTLCGTTAEWINENAGSATEPFADFTTFDFTGCSSTTNTGSTGDLTGTSLAYGGTSSDVGCQASVLSSSDVQISYPK